MEENEPIEQPDDTTPEIEIPEPDSGASTPPVEPEVPQGEDLQALAKQYDMSPADVIKAYGEARTKMSRSNQELADYRKRMNWAEQFSHELTTRKGLREHIESFFEDSSDRGVPPEVRSAIDPVAQELAQVRATLFSMEMNKKLDEIAKVHPMNQSVRDAVFEEVYRSNNADVEAHYWKLMGPKIAQSKDAEIQDASIAAKNKGSYTPLKGGSGGRKAPDVRSMSDSEFSEALDNEISSMFRRTE